MIFAYLREMPRKMLKKLPACILLFFLAACGGQRKEGITYSTNPGKDSSISIEVIPDTLRAPQYIFSDTVVVKIDAAGKADWVDDSLKITSLQRQVQDSMLSIYLHTGKLPVLLDIKYARKASRSVRGTTHDELEQARIVIKNVVAVAEYKRPFGRLEANEQDSIQKKYPILSEK